MTPSAQDRRDAPQYYSDPEAQRYFRENIFPNNDFHRAWEVYFESLSKMAEALLGAVRQALNLPDSEWSADTNRPASILRFLNYPETRSSAVFFYAPNWDCGLRPVSPRGVDSELGQMAEDFGLDELRDPDGSIPYYRLQNRAVDRGFTG